MFNIGKDLKEARESSGVSIEEAANDLNIKEAVLINLEEGSIGCFKDITELKGYIASYSKYLGLDSEKLLDEFNEYMFEYTSKIPLKEIEKKVMEQNKETKNKETVTSPYSNPTRKHSMKYYILIYSAIIVVLIIIIVWSINQIRSSKYNGIMEVTNEYCQ